MTYTSLTKQNKILKENFGITVPLPKKTRDLPQDAEGWFAIPPWKDIAKTYPEAVQSVSNALKKRDGDKFYNWKEGQIDDKHLRRIAPNVSGVTACQLGTKYKGVSVENVRKKVGTSEFLLGVYEILIIYLTNPQLFTGQYYGIDCAGDEWSWQAGGVFSESPILDFYGVRVRFGTRAVGYAYDCFGSGSGFLSQTNLDTGSLEPVETLPSFDCPHCEKPIGIFKISKKI